MKWIRTSLSVADYELFSLRAEARKALSSVKRKMFTSNALIDTVRIQTGTTNMKLFANITSGLACRGGLPGDNPPIKSLDIGEVKSTFQASLAGASRR